MKVSIITVVYNGAQFIEDCIQSVLTQTYPEIEYIVIDGASTDDTLQRIKKYESQLAVLISEPDKGMYDAINKGLALATGEIVGLLNADDMLADPDVITAVVRKFKETGADAVYGDLNYIDPQTRNVIRKWKGRQCTVKDIAMGWMPAHPTLYIKRLLLERTGNYALDMSSAADYEFMVRMLYRYQVKAVYLPVLMVNMRTGGISNATVSGRFDALMYDYSALKRHKIPFPYFTVLIKKLRKIKQFF